MLRTRASRRSAWRLLRGAVLIGAVTAVSYRVHLNEASAALLYLITVVLQSLDCTFPEAAALSVLATLCLDYFFTKPLFSLTIAEPLDAVTLISLLIVSLIVTRIQLRSRAVAEESKLQRANLESLYKVSQELLALTPPAIASGAVVRPFLAAHDIAAVCIFDAATSDSYQAGTSRGELEAKTRESYISGRDAAYPEVGIAVRCLRARDRVTGAIGFEGLRNPEVAAPALAALAGAALERAEAFRSATTAAAHAEAETLRSALLDALAHEFKTPLATILTAAGGLRVGASSAPEKGELTELIETEATRLADLTSRLLRLARVEREELQPRLEPTDAAELAERSVRRYAKLWPDRKVTFHEQGEVGAVSADPELAGLAISQLVENACRYSGRDGNVEIELSAQDGMAALTVRNSGPAIAENETRRIFERFYRGAEARRSTAGSGLGLYVTRKIALAHGGDVVLVENRVDGVAFRLIMPLATVEAGDAEREL